MKVTTSVTTPRPVLKLGSTGKRVRTLEERLKALGYLKGTADASFGEKTKAAVIAYKKDKGWNPKGVVGERMSQALKLGAPNANVDSPAGTETPSKMKGATYNCLVGRDPKKVAAWVGAFAHKHKLDFMQLQEINPYHKALSKIPGYHLITFPASKDHGETGVLVRNGIKTQAPKLIESTVGYSSKDGDPRAPRGAASVQLAGWLRVVSLHAPPAINWVNGHATGPAQRIKSYQDLASRLLAFARRQQQKHPKQGLLMGGDWNEGASSTGKGSPSWIAANAGMKKHAVHGIDWEMARGATVTGSRKGPDGGSDHRIVTFTVSRPGTKQK